MTDAIREDFNREIRCIEVTAMPASPIPGTIYQVKDGDTILIKPGGEQINLSGSGGGSQRALYQYRVVANDDPAAILSGDWRDVQLTEIHPGITGASVAAGVVTLPAGDYILRYRVGYSPGASAVGRAQCRVYDVTGDDELSGSGGYPSSAMDALASFPEINNATWGSCPVTIEDENDFKLQVQVTADGSFGAAIAFTDQACAELEIIKL